MHKYFVEIKQTTSWIVLIWQNVKLLNAYDNIENKLDIIFDLLNIENKNDY